MARFKAMFGTNSRLAVIGLILEGLAAGQMTRKLDESMAHQRPENAWKLSASAGAIIAGVGNLIHDGVINGAKAGSVRLARAAEDIWVRRLGFASRGLGVVAAGVLALWDLKNSAKEALKGNFGVAGLYFVSFGAGLGVALIFSGWLKFTMVGLSAAGWGVILIFAAIGVSLWIDYIKNNSLQDWMERSYFGKLERERYGSLEVEMQQYELAMEALGVRSESEVEDDSSLRLVPQAG
ncbi:hypothetical protein QC820_16430 [Halomonas mongoliensis]|uniref:Uncharacterized protein n=1 Tax=Halomonas mongoliensis TaxID=321265 RepID=A0ABU1GS18_9GAMM|nr:hypothetical protein [Halomonas mongoliensis]MDR5894377.1 hypothetical protein [Halomonas mongoliensis]